MVLLAAGPVVQALVPGDGEIRSAREQVITYAWLATALAAVWLLVMLFRSRGRWRDRTLAKRFPESVVFGAVRTGEVLSAYRRLIAPQDPRRARLPLTYTVVVDAARLSIWGGGSGASARALYELPAEAIERLSPSLLDDNGTKRPTIVVELRGLAVASLPISPIGGGLHGASSLSLEQVAMLTRQVTDRLLPRPASEEPVDPEPMTADILAPAIPILQAVGVSRAWYLSTTDALEAVIFVPIAEFDRIDADALVRDLMRVLPRSKVWVVKFASDAPLAELYGDKPVAEAG